MMQSVRKTGGISMMKAAIVFGVLVVLRLRWRLAAIP
jgi:hypothetical protein